MRQRLPLAAICAVLGLAMASVAGAQEGPGDSADYEGAHLLGKAAAPFVLPTVAGDATVDSDTLFDAYGATLLAFWTTHCAECRRRLEICDELNAWGQAEGFHVVAINFDEYPTSKTRLLAESAAPGVLHLYDPGGRVASVYGAGAHSFVAYLLDPAGRFRGVYAEIQPEELTGLRPRIGELLDESLDEGPDQPLPEGTVPPASAGHRPGILEELGILKERKIELTGRGRLRWMNVDTTGTGAVGANNEPLVPGTTLRHRVELTLTYAITPKLKAGALLWISNEGELVLRSGPEYLSTPWGSLILRYQAQGRAPGLGRVQMALAGGFYRVAMTPLTLMRWDANDTPIAGGQRSQGCGVCGSGGMAGIVRLESLEKIDQWLSFEGLRLDFSFLDHVDLTALYARPQTPRPDDVGACSGDNLERFLRENDATTVFYHQDLFSMRLVGHAGLPWTSDLFEVAGTAVLVDEDEKSSPCANQVRRFPFRNRVLTTDLTLPLPYDVTLTGEVAGSRWNPSLLADPLPPPAEDMALRIEATHEMRSPSDASLAGLSVGGLRSRLQIAYQRMGPQFFSAYSALSYESNLQGWRGTLRLDWGRVGIGGFYKHLKQINEIVGPTYASESEARKATASIWADADLWSGGVLTLGGVFEDRDLFHPEVRASTIGELGPRKQNVVVLSFEQQIAPRCLLRLEGDWLEGEWLEGVSDEGDPPTYATYMRDYASRVIYVLLEFEF